MASECWSYWDYGTFHGDFPDAFIWHDLTKALARCYEERNKVNAVVTTTGNGASSARTGSELAEATGSGLVGATGTSGASRGCELSVVRVGLLIAALLV